MTVFIYTLSDPRTGIIRYVGKTLNLRQRFARHVYDKSSTHKARWIRSVIAQGARPIMEVLEEIHDPNEEAWQEAERFWISCLKFYGFDLANSDDGGNGGKKPSAETRAKQSAVAKGRVISPATKAKLSIASRNMSVEARAKISESLYKRSPELRASCAAKCRGQKRSAETIKKLSAAKRGRVFSVEHLRKLSESHIGNRQPEHIRIKISNSMKELRRKQREQRQLV